MMDKRRQHRVSCVAIGIEHLTVYAFPVTQFGQALNVNCNATVWRRVAADLHNSQGTTSANL